MTVRHFVFRRFEDERGAWQRVWESGREEYSGLFGEVSEVSISINPHPGTLRGLHSLDRSANETKVVFCVSGAVQDVVVDVQASSRLFGTWESWRLTPGEGLIIPPGYAHGFLTLEPDCSLVYLMNAPYSPGLERNFAWDDPAFGIDWFAPPNLISAKDASTSWIAP